MDFRRTTPQEVESQMAKFKSLGKPIYTNYFGFSDTDEIESYTTEKSIVIRKKESTFFRLYLRSYDRNELSGIMLGLDGGEYILNIPSRKPIDDWIEFMPTVGFSLVGIYNRYHNTKVRSRKAGDGSFAKKEEILDIIKILNDHFTPYTDYLPDIRELEKMQENNQILVSHDDDDKVGGVLIYTMEGRKCYLNAWIDHTGKGLFLLYKIYNICAELNINYVYFWVNSENTDVIRLHKLMGAEQDAIVDYTFKKI